MHAKDFSTSMTKLGSSDPVAVYQLTEFISYHENDTIQFDLSSLKPLLVRNSDMGTEFMITKSYKLHKCGY